MEIMRTLRVANLDGAFSTAFITLTTGSFLVGLLKEMKAGDLWLGLLTAVPAIAGLAQIPGSVLGRSFRSYKGYIWRGGLLWRLLHIPLAIAPLVAFATNFKLFFLLACVGIAALAVNLVNPIYGDWLGRLIPESSRGTFYGKRNSLMAAVGTVIGLAGGLLVDALKRQNFGEKAYSAVFTLGLVCAAISYYFFSKMTDLEREQPIRANVQETVAAFKAPFQNPVFRRLLAFLVIFIAGQSFAGMLWGAYAIESLDFSQTDLQILALCHAVGNVSMSRWWGYLADKYGNKPILLLVGFGLVLTPIPWLLTQPGNMVFNKSLLFSLHVLMGMVWSGVALCQYNIIFSTSPLNERSTYLGSAMAVQSIAGAVPPILGAALLSSLRGGFTADQAYKITFVVTMTIRVVALVLLTRVKEEGSKGLKETLSHLKAVTPGGIRAMRSFSRSGQAEERETAIRDMADRRLSLAAGELAIALHDPSPRVRRQAATALGRIGDHSAVMELLHQLKDHPDLVEEETVEALGLLGDSRALPELVNLLGSPRPLLRRTAAKAIAAIPGSTDDVDAVEALIAVADDPIDPDLRRAALQALRNMEANGIVPVVAKALLDKHPSVRIAAAEAAGDLHLVETAAACRRSLEIFQDEASSEVAYALGVNGEWEDADRILGVAEGMHSMITRRRCLLGVARLFAVERDVYRLLMQPEMDRDKSLIQVLTIGNKRSHTAVQALEALSNGDEIKAVRLLSLGKYGEAFTTHPVPESFVVAACIYRKRIIDRTAR